MTTPRPDLIRIADMLQAIERIDEVRSTGYEAFAKSWLSQSAVIRELEILGEAAGSVSAVTRARYPRVEWRRMRGFSSFTKHEYWRVAPQLVWQAVVEMPALRRALASSGSARTKR